MPSPYSAQLTVSYSIVGPGLNESFQPPLAVVNANAPGPGQIQSVGTSFTSISVPSTSTGVIIRPQDSGTTLTLKGVSGDTGVGICVSSGNPTVLSWPAGATPASFGLVAGSATTVLLYWY